MQKLLSSKEPKRRRWPGVRPPSGSAALSEFNVSLFVFFFLIFFPLINLVALGTAGGLQYFMTVQIATKCSQQLSYHSALNAMQLECQHSMSSGFGRYLGLIATSGYQNCGANLYIDASNITNGADSRYGPNTPLPESPDPNDIYEFSVASTFQIRPFVNLGGVPFIGRVPGLGQPVKLSFTADRAVENPQALTDAGALAGNGSLTFPQLADLAGNDPPPNYQTQGIGNGWRDPTIYSQIAAAGQTVVSSNVIQVYSDYGNGPNAPPGGWVNTGLTIQPGQQVWIDTQAAGAWGSGGGSGVDANGMARPNTYNIAANLNGFMLIGWSGPNLPILPYAHVGMAVQSPQFIPSGDTLLNYFDNYSGPIYLACNDNEQTDTGSQMVRVIVTSK